MSKRKKRRIDFLEPITGTVNRKRFCTIDIESKDGDSPTVPGFTRPFLVGLFDPKNNAYQEFRDAPHLRERPWQTRHILPGGCIDKLLGTILTRAYSGCIFYAHNGGSFDHLFLLTWLREHRDEFGMEVIPVQSTIQVIRVWRKPEKGKPIKEKWEFLDSMRLLPMGLERACKTFNLPGKVPSNLSMHEDDPRWSTYLQQDCKALSAVMFLLYDMVEMLGGEVGITAPSTAMKLFRRRFLGKDDTPDMIARYAHWQSCANKDACPGCAHDWIRRGYYGGRTEIFRMFGEGLHYFDLNSSYVSAMREEMPIGTRIVEDGRLDWRRHPSQGGRCSGFCECTVYVPPDCPIPPLPHRDSKTGKLTFPTGQFHGVWSVEELRLLEDTLVGGRIVHVTRTVWFQLQPMFGRMVDELWKLRDKSLPGYDVGLDALAKLLGNSTYGKFAMKQERTSVVFVQDEVDEKHCFLCGEELEDGQRGLCTSCQGSKPAMPNADGDVWYQANSVDADYIIPHIAAHITTLARIRLWEAMKLALTTRKEETRPIREMVAGSIFFLEGLNREDSGALSFVYVAGLSKKARAWTFDLRYESEGKTRDVRLTFDPSEEVYIGGMIAYSDTDSVITDVMLPTSSELGALKDEYPGDELRYMAVQPKVYVIEKMNANKSAMLRAAMLREAFSGDDSVDPSTFGGDAILEESKVTMKGFPPRVRTKENLDRLRAGETLGWTRLEKVRSLSRVGFRRPPQMIKVTKSFQSSYDKRIVQPDGSTRAIVLNEPVGGFRGFIQEAAE